MHFLRRHWYNLGLIPALLAIVALAVLWRDMDVLQRLLLLNFVVILIHQYEEYGWPGGEPAIINLVLQPSPTPNRYPLNQNSAMVINVLASYGLYLVPVFLPRVIWLGLAPVLFGMSQFIVHGIVTPRKMRSIYNPGLAAVVLGHIPIGVFYIYYIQTHGLARVWDWVLGVAYMFAFVFITLLKMTYTWLADPESPFVFDEVEMRRFSVREKLDRRHAAAE
jgi:hypothetical protein